jgi:hypothetical protein
VFAENNGFFNKVASLIPDGRCCGGINTAVGKNVLRVRHAQAGMTDYFNDRELALNMTLGGLPLGTDKPSPFQVLTGDDLRTMETSQIDIMLKKGALMDVPALRALHDLGFGKRIGIKAGERINDDDIGIEEYNFGFKDGFNSSCFCQPLHYFYNDSISRFVKLESDEKAEKWSIIRNCTGNAVAPGLLVRENEFGERFAVVPFTGDPLKKFTANYDRSRQLRRVFSYIARRPLPLAVQETAPYIWLLINRTADNRLVAGVVNCSSDTIEELPLLAGNEFAKGVVQITCDGEKDIPLVSEVTPDPDGTGAMLFNLKMTLKPLDFALLAAVE